MNVCENCKKRENATANVLVMKVNEEVTEKLLLCEQCMSGFKSSVGVPGEIPGLGIQDVNNIGPVIEDLLKEAMRGGNIQVRTNHPGQRRSVLDEVGINITEQAEKGLLFPLSGRDKEIRRHC